MCTGENSCCITGAGKGELQHLHTRGAPTAKLASRTAKLASGEKEPTMNSAGRHGGTNDRRRKTRDREEELMEQQGRTTKGEG